MLGLLCGVSTLAFRAGGALPGAARVVHSRAGLPVALGSLLDLMGGGEATLIDPKKALPGRTTPMMVPDRHYVLGNKMKEVPEGYKVAVFANGCFWGSEKVSANIRSDKRLLPHQ